MSRPVVTSHNGRASVGHNHGAIEADTSNSTCFDSLEWEDGIATATFLKDGTTYDYPMSRSDFRDWIEDDSLGGYFNDMVR